MRSRLPLLYKPKQYCYSKGLKLPRKRRNNKALIKLLGCKEANKTNANKLGDIVGSFTVQLINLHLLKRLKRRKERKIKKCIKKVIMNNFIGGDIAANNNNNTSDETIDKIKIKK